MDEPFGLEEANATLQDISDIREYDENLETVDTNEGHALPEGIQFYQTSTTAYKTGRNPRTVRASYDQSTNTMYVVFWEGVYIYYEDVPPEVWSQFKSAESKGKFLWDNGFDDRNGGRYKYGPVDMDTISTRRKAALASNYQVAVRLQSAYQGRRTSKTLYGRGHNYRLRGQGGFTR
jgi:KTSC domain